MNPSFRNMVNELQYGNTVERLMKEKNLQLDEARQVLGKMSFTEYNSFVETITPPSGATIGPSASPTGTAQAAKAPTNTPANVKAIWPGQGAPIEVGMTVGLKGPNNLPVPGEITQVDMAAKGVKVKNPTTGQAEWQSTDNLQPYQSQQEPGAEQPGVQQPSTEDVAIKRLRELAGIKENCSAGATGAGAIAIAPAAVGKTIKRTQPTEESLEKEYQRKEAPKTIVGDTKPHQASGELSANLAASGKKTASRINNGYKK